MRKKLRFVIALLLLSSAYNLQSQQRLIQSPTQQNLKLWYQQPAARWVEALPIGNGKIGAMIFGGTGEDLIQLNETTLWSGGPVKQNVNPESASYLPLVRNALLEENNYSKADSLLKKMQGNFTESYLPMGDLVLNQDFKNGSQRFTTANLI